MADGNAPNPQPEEPKEELHPVKEQLFLWANIGPRFWAWINLELSEVRKAPVAFLIILATGLFGGKFLSDRLSKDEAEDQKRLQAMSDRVNDQQRSTIDGYRQDRENLVMQAKGLLPKDIAAQIASNMPPDKILMAMLKEISDQSSFDFEIYVNDAVVTNGSVINLHPNREITITAKNIGITTAESVEMTFVGSIWDTNLNAASWKLFGDSELTSSDKRERVPMYKVELDGSLPSDMGFRAEKITVLTNFIPTYFTAEISVHAKRSKRHKCTAIFILEGAHQPK